MAITPLDLQQDDKQLKGRLQDGQLDGPLNIKDDGRKQADLHYSQGELQGVLASLNAIAMITSPLIMTTTYSVFTIPGARPLTKRVKIRLSRGVSKTPRHPGCLKCTPPANAPRSR